MFSGIVQEIGHLKAIKKYGRSLRFEILSKLKLKRGASVSVNGTCLTVTKKLPRGFMCDVIDETIKRTNLGHLKAKDILNLEPSITLQTPLDGHLVTGHIDGTVKILNSEKGRMTLELPKKLSHEIVEKGSITLNGVSLTVAEMTTNSFTVALTPYTQKHTNLGIVQKGDLLNLEIDILASYISRLYENRHRNISV